MSSASIPVSAHRTFVALGWCLAAFATAPHRRVYTLHITPGCEHMQFTLESLDMVLESQRRVWEQFGIERPWWSVLSADQYNAKAILNDDEAYSFYATGETAVARALEAVDLALSDGRPAARAATLPWAGGGFGSAALDFGCGVGRLANALARRFYTVFCVDHSTHHLELSRLALERHFPLHAKRVVSVPTTSAGAEVHRHLPPHLRPEFVLSLLSLQHMVPQLQVAAIEHLCDALAIGGLGYIQLLTNYSDAPYVNAACNPWRALAEPGMHLHFLPLSEVHGHLQSRGCHVAETRLCDDFVSIPTRNSTSHCVVFVKVHETTTPPELYDDRPWLVSGWR